MMKNAFYFTLKTLFVLKIFNFFLDFLVMYKDDLIRTWNYNTYHFLRAFIEANKTNFLEGESSTLIKARDFSRTPAVDLDYLIIQINLN